MAAIDRGDMLHLSLSFCPSGVVGMQLDSVWILFGLLSLTPVVKLGF